MLGETLNRHLLLHAQSAIGCCCDRSIECIKRFGLHVGMGAHPPNVFSERRPCFSARNRSAGRKSGSRAPRPLIRAVASTLVSPPAFHSLSFEVEWRRIVHQMTNRPFSKGIGRWLSILLESTSMAPSHLLWKVPGVIPMRSPRLPLRVCKCVLCPTKTINGALRASIRLWSSTSPHRRDRRSVPVEDVENLQACIARLLVVGGRGLVDEFLGFVPLIPQQGTAQRTNVRMR